MTALTDLDLLSDDPNVGDTNHEQMHEYLARGVKAVKNLLVTLDSQAVRTNAVDQTIDGTKTFSSPVVGVAPTQNAHLSTKLYVDQGLSGKTDTGHVHSIANITSLQATLDSKANLASPTFTGTVGGITKSMVGLPNVDNTADTAKPVSTLQQTALNLKANLDAPTFTNDVRTNGTKIIFNPQTTKASIITEAASTIIDFGVNYFQAGGRVDSTRGAYFRIDTRDANTGELFSVATQEPGTTSPTETRVLQLSTTGILTVPGQVRAGTALPVVAQDLTRKDYVDNTIASALSTGVVKTTTDQTIAGVKTFTSAPKLKSTSTAGYAWVATGSDGSGDWSAIVNAPGGTVPWANITGKPSTFTPEAHVHAISDITSLSSTLSGKVDTTRTVTAGTGLTGGGDLSANRTFAVVYGTTASSAAQGNDSRLSDTRIPTDLSVTTAKIADANITLPKLATTAKPYDISFVQSLDTRAVGYGEMVYGIRIAKAITITSIHFRMGTADASGTTTCQLYSSATAAAANTAIAGTSGTAAIDPTAVTGSFSIAAGTYLYVYTSAIGTTPGKGLIAEIQAYLT